MALTLAADQKPQPVTRRTLPAKEGPVSLMGVLAVPASATLPATLRERHAVLVAAPPDLG